MAKKKANNNNEIKHITLGISTSALFDMRAADKVFRTKSPAAYQKYMMEREQEPFAPGHALELVQTLNDINRSLGNTLFNVVLISRNDMWSGVRAMKSCYEHGLDITSALFSNGADTTDYLKTYEIDWFISTHKADVEAAMKAGIAANEIDGPLLPAQALGIASQIRKKSNDNIPAADAAATATGLRGQFNRRLHLVWDFDRVLLGPEADDKFGELGLRDYLKHERTNAATLISEGPFMNIARVVGEALQSVPGSAQLVTSSGLTARSGDAALRAMHSLRERGIIFNGMMHFTGSNIIRDGEVLNAGIPKDRVLEVMKRQNPNETILFLDDSERTINATRNVTLSGLVPRDPNGIALGETRPADKKPQPK